MVELWGSIDGGHAVERVVISKGRLTASVITLGASLQDLRLEGHPHSLVLGFDSYFDYSQQSAFIGGVVGRLSNRIGGGSFTLNGTRYQLDCNEGNTTLHGGSVGFDKCLWTILSAGEDFVTLELRSADGDMGFPGEVVADCRYRITDDATLEVIFRARTDKPTVCSMSQHSYFNLNDGGATPIDGHRLMVDAPQTVGVDTYDVPDGTLINVDGLDADFTSQRLIGSTMLDINYCLSDMRVPKRHVARLVGDTGVAMDVATTEPGLQLYTSDFLDRVPQRETGVQYGFRSGVCIEPQVWPDAPNNRDFPSAVLMPGETLKQETTYSFSIIG